MQGDELNPQHPVTQAVREQWHKLLGIVLMKYDLGEVIITARDVDEFIERYPDGVVVAHDKADGLHIRMVTREEGERLAREHGGLAS